MKNMITRWIASAVALFAIAQLKIGIVLAHNDVRSFGILFVVVIVLGLANALIRPVIMFFAGPVNCLTFGLVGLLVNIALFWIVGNLVPGFRITGFLPAAIGYATMGVISGVVNFALKDRGDKDDK